MISPTLGTSTSIARTVLPSSLHPHVERLDRPRVVVQDHRALEVLLGQVALVLGLQVDAPRRPGTRTSRRDFSRISTASVYGRRTELAGDDLLQRLDRGLVDRAR